MYGNAIKVAEKRVARKATNSIPTERPKTKGKHVVRVDHDQPQVAKAKVPNSKISLVESTKSEPIQIQKPHPNQSRRVEKDKDKGHSTNSDVTLWSSQKQESVPFQFLPLLKQRMGHMFDEKFHTDVIFLVGDKEERLEAHRLILSAASPVFEQLLYMARPMSVDNKMVLYEPEINFLTFEVFIKALYTGEVPICLTLAFALEVFYVAKKYDVKFLEKLLLEHVSQVVTTVNVFEALAVSTKMIELTSMIPACWRIIEEQTGGVLEHHLESMDSHTFARILERDQLSLEEIELFQYLVKWAAVRCKRRGLKTTGKLKRQMIEPLLKHIRFPTMDATTIHELVVPTRILDPKEVTAILTHVHGMDHKMSVPYKTMPRRKPQKFKHIFSGCYSSPKITVKKEGSVSSSSHTQTFSSDSEEDNFKMAPCNKIKTGPKGQSIQNTTTAVAPSPRPARPKKSPAKNSKRALKSQR